MTPARKTLALVAAAAVALAAALLLPQRVGGVTTPGPGPSHASGALILDAELASSRVLVGSHETFLAVTLRAPDGDAPRPPVDVAIVLDRSGSMEGGKLVSAKRAAAELVSALAPGDRFSLTVYGSDVQVLMPTTVASADAVRAALATIEGIYSDGGTNLSGGLGAGHGELARDPRTGAVARIVLISDGEANEGIVDPLELSRYASALAEQGISVTTLGVGLDFDERAMSAIAVAGRGNYYFAESASMLSELFERELSSLGATTATGVSLRVSPRPGVALLEAYGYELVPSAEGVTLAIADLRAGETRKVVFRVRIDARVPGELPVADLGASFTRAGSGEHQRLGYALAAMATESEGEVASYRSDDAVRHIERARTAKAINDATVLYEQGRRDAALDLIADRNQAVQILAADMGDEELAEEIGGFVGAASQGFSQAAAPASMEGKMTRKSNRKGAYDLMY